MLKLDVANGADRIGPNSSEAELVSFSDRMRRYALEPEDGELSKEGTALYAQIGRYEDRSAVEH